MKVAIPTEGKEGMDEAVSPHFGRSQTYTIIDTETGEVKTIENTSEHMGGQGLPPELLHANDVEVILCTKLGHRAVEMFCNMGITTYIGAKGTVREALEEWRQNKLEAASEESSCREGRHEHHEGEHDLEHHGKMHHSH